MKRVVLAIIGLVMLSSMAIAVTSAIPEQNRGGNTIFSLIGHSNTAWVRKYNGHQIMLVRGTHYEMGYQHGAMLSEETKEDLRAYLNAVGQSESELLQVYNRGAPYLPQDYKDEMQGLSDSSGISIDDIHAAHTIPTLHHCSGFAVWGNATTDGKVYHTRSLDYGVTIADPDTGVTIQNNSVVIFREPDDGYANVVPSWAGFIGSVDGMNEKKISIGEMGQGTNDSTQYGLFMIFRLRYVLEHSSNLDEAVKLMGINRTYGYSFIVADGNINKAKMLEMSWHRYYNGTWNNPEESNGYPVEQYPINDVVRRGNHYVAYQTALTGRDVYFMLPTDGDFIHYANYYDLGRIVQENYGNIDFNKAMEIFRDEYRRYPMQMTLHQVVFDPSDLKLMVADAYPEGTSAFWNTYYEYSMPTVLAMPDLLNITSPTNGSSVGGTVTITPSYLYTPNTMKFYVDGVEVYSTNTSPYTYNWDSTTVANGEHVLEVRAFGDNYSAISYITVNVNNKNSNPVKMEIPHESLNLVHSAPLTMKDMIINLHYPRLSTPETRGSNDWIINKTTYLNGTTKLLNGNVTINNASLIMDNSTLIINDSYDGQYGIVLSNHASLILKNSSKIENKTARFYIYADSSTKEIKIMNSEISGGGERAEHALLYTEADNFTAINSTFIHSGYGIILNGKSTLNNVTVKNCTFYIENPKHYPIGGITTPREVSLMLGNTQNASITDIKVYGIGNGKLLGFGVLLSSSKGATLQNIYVEHEDIGFGVINSQGNFAKDVTVMYSNIGGGFLFNAKDNVIDGFHFEHGAGAIADVENAPQNTIRNIYANDTSIAMGAEKSDNVTFENITILNSGIGPLFKSTNNLVLKNATINAILAGIALTKNCDSSIIEGANITLEKDLFGLGVKNSPNTIIKNVKVHHARYALHIEGKTLEDYNITVSNVSSDSGEVKYYYGNVPSTASGAEIFISGVNDKTINVSTVDAPVYLAMASNVHLNVSMENVVNGVVIYRSTNVSVNGYVKNSSTYGLMAYDVNHLNVSMNVSGACWGYAVHRGKDIYIRGNATSLKDSAIYSLDSHAKFEINTTSSKYGIISSYSQIYIVGNVPQASQYYHIYNSTIYLANWLHVIVLNSTDSPIYHALVNISFNGKQIFSGYTDANGNVNEIVPYGVWNNGNVATNLTTIEVSYSGYSFDNNPRSVDMSSEHTEIFKESTIPEFSGWIMILVVIIVAAAMIIYKEKS